MSSVTEYINAAIAAYSRGDLKTALKEGETALRRRPSDPSILQLLGVICCQAGEPKRGAEFIRKAIRLGADTPDNRFNLARALVDLGSLDEAEALCVNSTGPQFGEMRRLYPEILKAQGRVAEAIVRYEELVRSEPKDFESWNNLGNARHNIGDLDGAYSALHQARALNPKSSLVHTNLGRLLTSMDRYSEACLSLEQAVLNAPNDPEPLLELARALTSISHPAAALKALANAARLNPKDPKIYGAMAIAFSDLSDPAKAEQACRLALQADPDFAPVYLNLGILMEKANRVDELNALVSQAAAKGIAGGEIDYLRALSLSRSGATEEALDIAKTVTSNAISTATVAHFAGQLADKLNRVDEAFAFFETMNESAAKGPLGVGIDRSAYRRGVEVLSKQTTRNWFSSWSPASAEPGRPAPAFLVGFPRSGTTLLDTVLMGHDGTHVLEEIPILETISGAVGDFARIGNLNQNEIRDLRSLYFSELDKVSPPEPEKLVIDKNPLSMIRMPLIHRIFPDAKIILALRHPCDVVLSCFMQDFKVTESTAGFLDMMNACLTYDRLFNYWQQCRELLPLRVHEVRYEAIVSNLEAEVRPLLHFLDLPWDQRILDHQRTAVDRGYIRTPSYAQVTERLYARASGRWTRYRTHMTHVLPILAPWADRFGYSLD